MKNKLATIGFPLAIFLVAITVVQAFTTVIVTPGSIEGWSTADTRPGGTVEFVADVTSPFLDGALRLTTDSTNTAKAQYLHAADVGLLLADVTELAYSTKQISANFPGGDASYQLIVDLNGGGLETGFTTFVFEPYQNGVVVAGQWQTWDVDAGQLWSSRSFSEGTCTVTAGAGGAPFYSLSDLQANCPGAVVLGFGVNVGTYNPSYDVYTDGVVFNGTMYDFELTPPAPVDPITKAECMNGGWQQFDFLNQGQCVRFVETGKDSR
jgi:hypothetical protein